MGIGFECYDAAGRLTFSASDRLGRVLGIVNVSGAAGNGSFTDANLVNGEPYAIFFRDGSGSLVVPCIVSIAGQTIFWNYGGPYASAANNPGGFILYGVR